jgi:hypothetical protein
MTLLKKRGPLSRIYEGFNLPSLISGSSPDKSVHEKRGCDCSLFSWKPNIILVFVEMSEMVKEKMVDGGLDIRFARLE